MRICIPTDTDEGREAPAAEHFGHARYFTLVDSADDAVTAVANPACHARAGACHHVPLLRARRVDAVAGPRIGRRARAALLEAGIEVHQSSARTVAEVVDAVRSGATRRMNEATPCESHRAGAGHAHRGRRRHRHGAGRGRGRCA